MKRVFILLAAMLLLVGCVRQPGKDALLLSPESLANRQLQTRRFDTGNTAAVLSASNAVLQDLGFNLDETSVELGVVVASKQRDATDGGQVFLLILLGGLANNPNAVNSADAVQIVKASLVVRGLDVEDDSEVVTELSPEQVQQMREKVYSDLFEDLHKTFSDDICEKVAKAIAENAVDTLSNDLYTFMSVEDVPGSTAVRVTFQRAVLNRLGQLSHQEQINDVALYQEFFEKLSKSLFLEANQI